MYIHGGISKHGDTHPQNSLYKMDLGSQIWTEVR